MTADHEQRLQESFAKQASTFENPRLNTAFTSGLPWLVELSTPQDDDVCLDVAAGTGLISRALSPHVSRVVAVDSNTAMLFEGRRQAEHAGLSNVTFVLGDARKLPCRSASFSLVITRFSLHHFDDPLPALTEMVRACRPGGRLVVMDLVASVDPDIARRQDHIENLRDPSHLRMPAEGAVGDWLSSLGLQVTRVERQRVERPVEQWLAQARTDDDAATAVRTAFEREIAGGEPTGLQPSRRGGELWFRQTWEVTVASRT